MSDERLFDLDSAGLPCLYTSRYRCVCGKSFTETWSCACDAECPKCGAVLCPEDSGYPEDLLLFLQNLLKDLKAACNGPDLFLKVDGDGFSLGDRDTGFVLCAATDPSDIIQYILSLYPGGSNSGVPNNPGATSCPQ